MLLAFEESRDQLTRNAEGWGMDFERYEREGLLKIHCVYPEACSLEDHELRIRDLIEEYQPTRVALDSLTSLERTAPGKSFREFVLIVTSMVKEKEIAGLFTSTTPSLLGSESVTEAHISSITDSIILLRYVETLGTMRRGLTVLKMRGSPHDKDIHEYTIDSSGMHVGRPFKNVTGILAGRPTQIPDSEADRMRSLFMEAPNGEG